MTASRSSEWTCIGPQRSNALTADCRKLDTIRITNSPAELRRAIARAGRRPGGWLPTLAAELTAEIVQPWVAQQARNLPMDLDEAAIGVKFVLHDRDASFSAAFDAVFQAAGIRIIRSACRLRG